MIPVINSSYLPSSEAKHGSISLVKQCILERKRLVKVAFDPHGLLWKNRNWSQGFNMQINQLIRTS